MDSKEKIIAAAVEVFAEKGKHGARMEEIAAKANINKAMLYYFYTTRENLYVETIATIFCEVSKFIRENIERSIAKASSYSEKLKVIAKSHFDAYSHNLNYTKIMLEAMATAPDDLKKAIELAKRTGACSEEKYASPEKFRAFIREGIEKGAFRKVNPDHLITSIIGMNLIYFLAQPMAQAFAECGVEDDKKFLKERQDCITDLLLNGIMEKRNA